MALGEAEQRLKEVEKEVELWRQKERALTTVLQEKDAHISLLQAALQQVGTHVWHSQQAEPRPLLPPPPSPPTGKRKYRYKQLITATPV